MGGIRKLWGMAKHSEQKGLGTWKEERDWTCISKAGVGIFPAFGRFMVREVRNQAGGTMDCGAGVEDLEY